MPVDDAEELPLDGIRVVDLADRIGAYCGKLLADIGADVYQGRAADQ